jgi:hypothetical protein
MKIFKKNFAITKSKTGMMWNVEYNDNGDIYTLPQYTKSWTRKEVLEDAYNEMKARFK